MSYRPCLKRYPYYPGTTRTLSTVELAQVNSWNNIVPGNRQWLHHIQSNDVEIELHCYYPPDNQFSQSTSDDIFGHPNDHVNMSGERFSIDHRELVDGDDNNDEVADTIKYFTVTTREINDQINADANTPDINSESEFTEYINIICQRIFERKHPSEIVPFYFYKSIVYVAWSGGNEEVCSRITNQSLLQRIKAIKIGQSGTLWLWYDKMKKLHKYWCNAGGLYCVGFGIPPLSNNGRHVESTLHVIYLLANLSGEFHLSAAVRQSFHTYVNFMGLLGIRRGRIDDVIRPRELHAQPAGIRQQEAGIDPNWGSIYMIRRQLSPEWVQDLIRVFNEIRGSNLPTDVKNLALRYIRIFLEHVKVGAIRGVNVSSRVESYQWSQPFSFQYILATGFEDVFVDEFAFGNFLGRRWILGEFFYFTSIIDMRNALTEFVERNNHDDVQGIGQLGVHDGHGETVDIVNVSTLSDLIERGIITADFLRDLMVSGVYRYEIIMRDIDVNF